MRLPPLLEFESLGVSYALVSALCFATESVTAFMADSKFSLALSKVLISGSSAFNSWLAASMTRCNAVRVFSSATLPLLLSIRLFACSNTVCNAFLASSMLEPAFASRLLVTALAASDSVESDFSIADAFFLF